MSTTTPDTAHAEAEKHQRERAYARLLRPLLQQDGARGADGASTTATTQPVAAGGNDEENAFILSRLFLCFLGRLTSVATEKDDLMEIEDLDAPSSEVATQAAAERFSKLWDEECVLHPVPEERRVIIVCLKAVSDYVPGIIVSIIIETAAPFTGIVLLSFIADFMRTPSQPLWVAGVIAVGYFVAQTITAAASAQSARYNASMAMRLQGAIKWMVARKILQLRPAEATAAGGAGVMFQVFGSSVAEVANTLPACFQITQTVLQVVASFTYLFVLIGWPVVVGLAVFIIVLPINYQIADSFLLLFFGKMMAGAARTAKVVELINNIRAVKLYGWGQPLRKMVYDLREPELEKTFMLLQRIAIIIFSFSVSSPFVQVSIFAVLVAVRPNFGGAVVFFQSLGLISMLSLAMIILPFFYSNMVQLRVAAERLRGFFSAAESVYHLDEVVASAPVASSSKTETDAAAAKTEDTAVGSADSPTNVLKGVPVAPRVTETNRELFLSGKFSWAASTKAAPASPAGNEPAAAPPAASPPGSASPAAANVAAAAAPLCIPQRSPFVVSPGDLVMVVGKLGSGKSTLVNALVGDVPSVMGATVVLPHLGIASGLNNASPPYTFDTRNANGKKATLAFVPQSPWVINATVRNNIIMFHAFDEKRYEDVIDAVELRVDLATLPNGDLTEIGEKGINLSGGQKQRLSIARALYADADIYLFDDPLSALDAHVGRAVFNNVIRDRLSGKARVLVTNQLQFLHSASRLYITDGMTLVHSPMPLPRVPEVVSPDDPPLIQLLRAFQANGKQNGGDSPAASPPLTPRKSPTTSNVPSPTKKVAFSPDAGKLTVQEERQKGQVNSSTLFTYLGSFGGAPFAVALILLQIIGNACELFSKIWMGMWSGGQLQSLEARYSVGFFLGLYVAGIVASAVFVFLREMLWRSGAVSAPRLLYDRMVNAVVCAPLAFFDTTPTGRIVNRFTKDSETLDFQLPMAAGQVVSLAFQQVFSLASVCYFFPYFTPVAAVFLIMLIFVQPTVATVVLRRLSSTATGPVMALLSEMVGGASSIRALGLTDAYIRRFVTTHDDFLAAYRPDRLLIESVRCRVNLMMAFVQFLLILVLMLSRGSIDPGFATSFVIVQSISLTQSLAWMMIQRGTLALSLNSVERMNEYIALTPESQGETLPAAAWPATGSVAIKALSAKYRPELETVLKEVSFDIKSGEKVGVVGRTGSGKSSLLLALFRLIPVVGGSVAIDGVGTDTMPVDALRTALAAIPQEPVLFSGTVRDNLDPFKKCTDDALRDALRTCHVWPILQSKMTSPDGDPLTLEMKDGSQLSVGERQLLCLARAVARGNRIIVMDEATSAVDPHTDSLIQATIRSSFGKCTVITVAHRINTIMDSDKIVVMDGGVVKEFGSPAELLAKPDGIFASLVAESNEQDGDIGAQSPPAY